MIAENESKDVVLRFPPAMWAVLAMALAATTAIFYDGLKYMVGMWGSKEEYSYGYLIPAITLFLIWQRKEIVERLSFSGSWLGFGVVLLGVGLFFLGDMSTLYIIVQYAFLVVLAGLCLSLMGWRGFKVVWAPLLLLVAMIPLPGFLYQGLSSQLQLISSQIGVGVIRLFGISVFLEGNVIDLGSLKLQVVEACSGMRYLFPLMTLGMIVTFFFKEVFWKRAVIFLSTIPITVLMNSFRIGVIGVMVEYWGKSAAEGFLHDFEGWIVFMACIGVLVIEMKILTGIGKEKHSFQEVFSMDFPKPVSKDATIQYRALSRSFVAGASLLVVVTVASAMLPQRVDVIEQRQNFSAFPMKLDEWNGRRGSLEQIYIDVLKFDDYLLADYEDRNRHFVNLYVAYYASQHKGESAHSPRTCMPGGGWEITSLTQREIDGVSVAGNPLRINRAVIQKGADTQLVYYWFQQRSRVITGEYMVKWYLFWDALTRNRTDGAMVRMTASVGPSQSLEDADRQLSGFAKAINTQLGAYIPE